MENAVQLAPTAAGAVAGFFKLVNERNYPAAFGQLTEGFRQRVWKGNEADFTKGYYYNIAINKPTYTQIATTDGSTQFDVEYDDETEVLHHPLLDDLVGLTEEEQKTDAVREKIDAFKTLMLETLKADPEQTADIVDARFFEPNNVQVVLWLGKADYVENNADLFTRTTEIIPTYRRAICVETEKGWQIEGLKRDRLTAQ